MPDPSPQPAAQQLNYSGRCEGIEGDVVGPTAAGVYLVITSSYYDAQRDRTEAFLRPATQDPGWIVCVERVANEAQS